MTRLTTFLEKLIEEPGIFSPKVDIIDYTDNLKILIELPGVVKENIKISFQNNIVTIAGKYLDPENLGFLTNIGSLHLARLMEV